ncbi:hypothetical protein E1B28_006409 [Marasmius oreades]|uniref:SUZ domain-containing protein n=1 Tax=Marasmius oreades TaxID=181124 RepID=A0A9P7S5Y7_9AGAR|nr:uncharacterized protein E1B28_006409 [Marasmius oreades]KAG7095695.1 hypothetical protein E1B28_006409 [Marasmius oreades]
MATAAVASSSDSASDWGQPETSVHQPRPGARSKAVVRDDWEDEEDEESPNDEANKRIWEKADSKAPTPMPVVSTTSSRSVTSPPPPGAFQPALKILKRPTSAINVHPRTPSPASSESLKEREARYQEARSRIFGDADSGSESKLSLATNITRNPYGPSSSQASAADGFGKRGAPAPPSARESLK